MRRTIAVTSICLLVASVALGSDNKQNSGLAGAQLMQVRALKAQLYKDLTAGGVDSGTFDAKTEQDIADTQIALAKYYLDVGERENAAIAAVLARKILQRLYNNPYDPRLAAVYSLLVTIYDSTVDIDFPNQNMADNVQAKLYRAMLDRIHSQ